MRVKTFIRVEQDTSHAISPQLISAVIIINIIIITRNTITGTVLVVETQGRGKNGLVIVCQSLRPK